MRTAQNLRQEAKPWPKGHHFEDFELGQKFRHHWGRTFLASDVVTFSSLCLNYHPAFHNREYARRLGYSDFPVNQMLLFLTVFGMSVEDLSEIGGAFLGVDKLTFHGQPVVGDTVTARSEVVAVRESQRRPNQGIVTWRTAGYDQNGEIVVQFERTNLISKRGEVA